jgi:Caspase domain
MPLYALLIAINNYHPDSRVPSLSGCTNDVKGVQEYLQTQFPAKDLHVITLLDKEATYDNVLAHFGEKHLAKAQKGDTVLLHFSGHGARGFSAPEFKTYYPDGLDENLICYDSRLPDHYDLADKELAVLIERIATKEVDVIVLLDCCHSGSGTRNSAANKIAESRQWEDREDIRPLASYLQGHFNKKMYLPNARHLLLAACEKRQKAYELPTAQGLFTTNLLQVLRQRQGNISYAELFAETRLLMRNTTKDQSPQFEPFGHFNVHRQFLKSEDRPTPTYALAFEDGEWVVQAGALQGLSLMANEVASFVIFDQGKEWGFAQSKSVQLDSCTVSTEVALDKAKIYQTKLLSIPKPPIAVELNSPYELTFQSGLLLPPNNTASKKIGDLAKALREEKPLFFELTEAAPFSPFIFQVDDKGLRIVRRKDEVLLGKSPDKDIHAYRAVFRRLEHLCQYEKSRLIGEGTGNKNPDVKLLLQLLDAKGAVLEERTSPEEKIKLTVKDGVAQKQFYRFMLENNSGRAYYFALLHFTADYGVFPVYNEEVGAKAKALLMEKDERGMNCTFDLKKKTAATEYFKLIVSTKKINSQLLMQKEVDLNKLEVQRGTIARKVVGGGALEQWFVVDRVVELG